MKNSTLLTLKYTFQRHRSTVMAYDLPSTLTPLTTCIGRAPTKTHYVIDISDGVRTQYVCVKLVLRGNFVEPDTKYLHEQQHPSQLFNLGLTPRIQDQIPGLVHVWDNTF